MSIKANILDMRFNAEIDYIYIQADIRYAYKADIRYMCVESANIRYIG